jgi:hypothetical protein
MKVDDSKAAAEGCRRAKALDAEAEQIFRRLTDGLLKVGDSRQIDNSTSFMPLYVEVIGRHGRWPIYSLAHYYEQNGDFVCDPDVTFLVTDQVHPLTFEQGGVVYQVAVRFEGQAIHLNEPLQAQITEFCNQWLRNVAEQQA